MKGKTCKHNRIDVDFSDHKLAIEIDKNDHSHRNIDYEIKKQKAIEQELGCRFITTDPEKKKNLILLKVSIKYLGTSDNRLINWPKKRDRISMTLLRLEFKSDNESKSKAI